MRLTELDKTSTEYSTKTCRAYFSVMGILSGLLLLLGLGVPKGFSQAESGETPPAAAAVNGAETNSSLTAERVAVLIEEVSARTDLESALKQQILTLHTNSVKWLAAAKRWEDEALKFEQLRLAAEGEREVVQKELAQLVETPIEVPQGATLDVLRQERDQAEANYATARERLTATEAERDQRARRRSEMPAQVAALTAELEDVQQELAAAAPAGQAEALTVARQMERQSKLLELTRHLEALRREQANYEARTDLLPLRLERASKRVAIREANLRAWRTEVERRTSLEAERQAAEARRTAAQAHPILREVADTNVTLAERRRELIARIQQYTVWVRQVETNLLALAPQYEQDRVRLQSSTEAGFTDVRLRSRRDELSDLEIVAGGERPIRNEITRLQRERFNREYEKRRLLPVEEQKAQLLERLAPDIEPGLREDLSRELDQRLGEQRALYADLLQTYEEAERELIQVAIALDPLIRLNNEYRRLIDERVLWIRSMEPIHLRDLPKSVDQFFDLLEPGQWRDLVTAMGRDVREDPLLVFGSVILLGFWASRRRRIRARMQELATLVSRWTTDRYGYTLEATGYTTLNALFWPMVLWFFAWRAGGAIEAGPIATQVASGLYRAGGTLLIFGLVFQVIRESGLARAHFRWRDDTRKLLRLNLHWLQPIIVPLAFLMAALDGSGARVGENILGRTSFLVAMGAMTLFVMRILRPGKGIFHPMIQESKGRWLERLQYLWYPLAVALPVALGILAASGLFYTARQLEDRFLITFAMAFGLVMANELAMRWLFMARRALAIEEVRKRRRAAREEGKDTGPSIEGESGAVPLEENKLNISEVNTQTRKMVTTLIGFSFVLGIWMIWASMLPALGMLDRLVVWPKMEVRETVVSTVPVESIIGKDWVGRIPPPFQQPAKPFDGSDIATLAGSGSDSTDNVITVKNVILCLYLVLIMAVVSRNIPGVLEIMVLQKLPLEPSGRYAVLTLTRYLILVIGTILAFGAIGIGWNEVQWLVAAITLGIGFGLQEIVANFISGIIILFEQPIRVGDVVTVNGTSGVVSKIRMRATTIIDWDRKELIIPNKSFITGEVVNWTLNDPVLRLVIQVGIAYGSDTRKAEELLMQAATSDPAVLKDPAPSVVFWEFGDSALEFHLRVFLPHIGEMIRARHELHRKIDQAFREAGIEIAFPQRDIHIRSVVSNEAKAAVLPGTDRPVVEANPKMG